MDDDSFSENKENNERSNRSFTWIDSPACGGSTSADAPECAHCDIKLYHDTPLPQPTTPPPPHAEPHQEASATINFCPYCGKKHVTEGRFCSYCGKSIPGNVPPPSPPPSPPQSGNNAQQNGEKISTYLAKALFATLIGCMPLGIVAIVYSCIATSRLMNGDLLAARKAADSANNWATISILSVLFFILFSFIVHFFYVRL